MNPAALVRHAARALRGMAAVVFGSLLLMTLAVRAAPVALATDGAAVGGSIVRLDRALSVVSDEVHFPEDTSGIASVSLPDDWGITHPRHHGSVWYRVRFDAPTVPERGDLAALYIERVCSNVEVFVNGRRVYSGGRMTEPVTRNCHHPQLVALPGALLQPRANVLDLRVQGDALQRVAARQRGAGLSALVIGPYDELAVRQGQRLFWNVTTVQAASLALGVIGVLAVLLAWKHHRDASLGYFGLMAIGWALLSARVWWRDMPLDTASIEFLVCLCFTPILALAVQFLLSHAGVRSRMLEAALLAQCMVLPLSLLVAGPTRLFELASAWFVVLAAEAFAAMALHLHLAWRDRRRDFWPMAAVLIATTVALLVELGAQRGWLPLPPVAMLQFVVPALMATLGVRLLLTLNRVVQHVVEPSRHVIEARVREATAEIERNYAQMAEVRVEQVTEKERKRIAADLHDDLGAKLLTIVHTSESERISTLAREALEEMRLSVRGLTGRPVRLADALADWRAETVLRLGQANIEIDWRSLAEDTQEVLPARGYVQTTRILREAVSNIIKHSGASHCKVRCAISDGQFGINIQDNGRGIPMELDGKLDRGHGMSSMKHRAKQMQGQCLVESGPGYGTVIRLTLPLGPEASATPPR